MRGDLPAGRTDRARKGDADDDDVTGRPARWAGAASRRLARVPSRLRSPLLLGAIAAAEFLVPWRVVSAPLTLLLASMLTVRFIVQSVRHFRLAAHVRSVLRTRFIELALTAAALALLASKALVAGRGLLDPAARAALEAVYRQYAVAFLIVAGLRIVGGDFSVRRLLHRLDLRPAQTVALGFAATILAGTLLLSLPISVARLEALSLLDVLFTATSAVTVTGLVVYDPGSFHTPFGQAVLLALIQLGGLGTMAASASLVILAGRRLRLRQAAALQESMDLETIGNVRGQLLTVLALTVAAEAAGATALYLLWQGRPDVEAPAFAALFHAVSAFCNAGFSTFANGLAPFRDDLGTNAAVAALVVVGGLGVPVLSSLGRLALGAWRRRGAPLLTLHARLALATTGVLLAAGALLTLVVEWNGALAPLAWPQRLLAAGFLSVSARTAGFNTVDMAALGPATLWLLMGLMFVGGSPGSTAGGIKTTTAATVVATLRATLRGRPRVEAFRRTIPDEQVAKALALVGLSLAAVGVAAMALLATQRADPLALAFEAVSAFATVGLSAGVTSTLDTGGKTVVALLMFVGRTGPLTLGFALAARAARVRVTYPPEKIMIG